MMKPLLANVVLALLMTMPGCGKTELPPEGPGASFVKVGAPAPEIIAVDLDGKTFNLSDYRGKVVDLSFWADWCGWCVKMFPDEKKMVEKYKDRPFVLLGVNGDPTQSAGAESALRHKLTWRSFWNGGETGPITSRYRVQGWPTSFLIDANGIVRERVDGYQPHLVEAAIEKLVAEAEGGKAR
jgi:thiol-disulfide isomerase/thioredoxin